MEGAPPVDLDLLAAALRRASTTVDDPGRRVATALADDPLVQEWAAAEALKALGAPRHAGEMEGRLAVVAVGRHALAMLRGAQTVFGPALDEGLVVGPRAGTEPHDPRGVVPAARPTGGGGLPSAVVIVEAVADLPDAGAFEAGRRIAALAAGLGPRDRLLVLLSEGAARLPALPVGGLDAGSFRRAFQALGEVEGGAGVAPDLRARLDALQAGGLAALAAPTPILGLRLVEPPRAAGAASGSSLDPLGGPPLGGRTIEIALRRAGLWDALPRAVRETLRVDERHPALDPAREGPAATARTAGGVRDLDGKGAGLSTALAEARRRGLQATVLTAALRGDAAAAGRGLARVGRALQDGVGGLTLPACGLAEGRMEGGAERHGRFARAAEAALEGRDGIRVVSWTPRAGGTDLCAVLVLASRGRTP